MGSGTTRRTSRRLSEIPLDKRRVCVSKVGVEGYNRRETPAMPRSVHLSANTEYFLGAAILVPIGEAC